MRYLVLTVLLSSLIVNLAIGQHTQRHIGDYTVFTIPFEGDSITFAVVARKGELTKRKPIFLFRQGSLLPLIRRLINLR
ncbi:hypothetical protein GO755_34480 [Spirosoma sp. HMF4905]|uniref:Uncharacterized protein n=1 Tax=Spirosoma arboris TaxID=2682092 RepID=A0A7K1SN11_9BACT|nr:hypothetical protein [Spirosoma arboris]MVM35182.1 hypothetical protein [Spirosoma arboris]